MMKRAFITLLFGAMTILSYAQQEVKVTTYQFAEKEGQALSMDVYVDSAAWTNDIQHPVFIFSFGGAWEHGSRTDGKAILESQAQYHHHGGVLWRSTFALHFLRLHRPARHRVADAGELGWASVIYLSLHRTYR